MGVVNLALKRRVFGQDEQRIEAILGAFQPGAGIEEFQRLAREAEHPRIIEAAFAAAPQVPAGREIASEYDGVYKLANLLRREYAPGREDTVATGDDRSRSTSLLRRAVADVVRDYGYRETHIAAALDEPRDREQAFFVRGAGETPRDPDALFAPGQRVGLVVTAGEIEEAKALRADGGYQRAGAGSASARVMATFAEAMQTDFDGVAIGSDGRGLAVFDARRVKALGGALARRDEQLDALAQSNLMGRETVEALSGAEQRAARAWRSALAETDRRIGANREQARPVEKPAAEAVATFLREEREHAHILATRQEGPAIVERAAAVRAMAEKRSGQSPALFERLKAGEPVMFKTEAGERLRLVVTERDLDVARKMIAGEDGVQAGPTARLLALCPEAVKNPRTGASGLDSIQFSGTRAVAAYLDPAEIEKAARNGRTAAAIHDGLVGAVDASRAGVVRAKQERTIALERPGHGR
ncbi:MAG TPA: hypothetical protein P5256_12060 [Beijerinckiaceae bacterium]|nr:hypothetical protein [Beijerinckiaceae bacterium]